MPRRSPGSASNAAQLSARRRRCRRSRRIRCWRRRRRRAGSTPRRRRRCSPIRRRSRRCWPIRRPSQRSPAGRRRWPRWRRIRRRLRRSARQPNLAALMANPSFAAALNQSGAIAARPQLSQRSGGAPWGYDGRRRAQRPAGARPRLLRPAALSAQPQSSQPPPPPPPEDPTTIVENPDAVPPPPDGEPPAEPVTPAPTDPDAPPTPTSRPGPTMSRRTASGFQLSTLETKNLSLLYIDPIQTYLTPYLGAGVRKCRSPSTRRCSAGSRGTGRRSCSRTSPITAMPRRWPRPATWSCSTSRRCRCRWRPSRRASASSPSTNHELAHVAMIDVWNKPRRLLAPVPRRQAGADAEAPGIDPLQFPHLAPEPDPALVYGRQRGVLRNLDGGRARPRPGRL